VFDEFNGLRFKKSFSELRRVELLWRLGLSAL
jgi:hypothetical protein